MTEEEKAVLAFAWKRWARPPQILPVGRWDGWLIIAGRGWGKTRVGAETIRDEVESGRSRRIGLIAETSADGRDVLVEGESGIMACSPPWMRPLYEPSKRRLTWRNGAIATLYDAREPDQLRGPQHDFLWFDELAKYRYADAVFDMAMFGLRLGDAPRWIVTTTPRPIALIRRLLVQSGVHVTRGRSEDNLSNISPTYQRNVIDRYRGTRLGRQELDAEILEDIPGALWSRRSLDEARVMVSPQLLRIVVGVDPAASSGEAANETGIIVIGMTANNQAYVLEDWSLRGSPDEWARKVVAAYRKHGADAIIAESNQGGEMVSAVIRSVADIPVKLVHATRGKYVRAEPISALYEQGRVHHVGTLPVLEDQMISFTPERAAHRTDGYSPDRVDALVWAATELFPEITAPAPGKPAPRAPQGAGGWMS
ncbi:MAG TPA: terminase family protein [Micropepsaceae bacterium]|nr:terminase family protein [Micropepsaceae bacterium]